MPTLVKAVPKYSKHKASGQAVATIGSIEHYLGPHGTKASRIEYGGEWMAAGRPSSFAKSADITIAELCKRYKAFAEGYYATAAAFTTSSTSSAPCGKPTAKLWRWILDRWRSS